MADDLLKFLADFQAREIGGDFCALCGMPYDENNDDFYGAVFVGDVYEHSRSVHAGCWDGFIRLCEHMGLNWRAAIDSANAKRKAAKPPLGKPPEWVTRGDEPPTD